MDEVNVCPNCKTQTQESWYFCPNCGKVLKEKPIDISLIKQILIYFVSFFLTPLGLYWSMKYIRNSDTKVKIIGWISIALTIAGVALVLLMGKGVIDQYAKMLNSFQ